MIRRKTKKRERMRILSSIFRKKEVPPDVTATDDESADDVAGESKKGLNDADSDNAAEQAIKGDTGTGRIPDKPGETDKGGNVSERALARFSSTIERLQIQLEALNVAKGATNERFTRISEQIGELRSMIIDNEKKMKSIDITATKSADLVSQVQPENLAKDMKKMEAKNEQLKAKIEANATVTNDIVKELKKIRNQMTLYKGTEGILKLNEDVKGELIAIQKLKVIIEGHSDKTEKIFMDMQKNFSEFQRIKNKQEDIENSFNDVKKLTETLRLKQQTLAERKDLIALEESADKRFHSFQKEIAKLNEFGKSIDTMADLTDKLAGIGSKNREEIANIKKELEGAGRSIKAVVSYLKKVTKALNEKAKKRSINGIKEELNEVKTVLKEKGKVIRRVVRLIELLKERADKAGRSKSSQITPKAKKGRDTKGAP